MDPVVEPQVEQVEQVEQVFIRPKSNLPWVRCKHCRRTITLPPEWRGLKVQLPEAAAIVLKVHQKRCAT